MFIPEQKKIYWLSAMNSRHPGSCHRSYRRLMEFIEQAGQVKDGAIGHASPRHPEIMSVPPFLSRHKSRKKQSLRRKQTEPLTQTNRASELSDQRLCLFLRHTAFRLHKALVSILS
ncbi:hypothetical protein IX321_000017 [Bacteroides pyogenes]|nr:hypothetical protein [Bacteroides pyogenes]MBR8707334.1 hypothetical protein [Bacteroides pyogenes]MBR8717322.1 hypothetical protein [Bacteroides pyogenes]MBR8745821.1 hypothetical protein [Bacteroides pyogenes]MBR8755897.1 hypothetical protein [Bacteroides pyogenes]